MRYVQPRRIRRLLLPAILAIVLYGSTDLRAYSVLTHEQIVDLLWKDEISVILKQRFPGIDEAGLQEAHAYAYGGSVIQDLGYYPFGSAEFSNLLHYVRSGDVVLEMLRQSKDANELAFSLGALAHYASDLAGHPAVNESVALLYPKLRAEFGNAVRYAQDKSAHLKTEFGFDVVQIAKNRYTSQQYHDFIGFEVSKPLLERVFPIVYGVAMTDVLPREDLVVGTYRYAVNNLIPKLTDAALSTRKQELLREVPDFDKKKFLFNLSRADFEKEWGREYSRPGFLVRFLSLLLKIIPRFGPFKALAFKNPTPQTEDLYIKSINDTVEQYRKLLEQVRTRTLNSLPNRDFDTGNNTRPAEYTLTDETYADLLLRLEKNDFSGTTPELRADLTRFYSNLALPIDTKHDKKRWRKVLSALDRLKTARAAEVPPATRPQAGAPRKP